MQNIQDMVISNYQSNMEYFKTNYLGIFNKLTALEILLDERKYPQRYDLEYKDDYFDVVELNTKYYLYNTNSDIYSNELTRDINLKKNNQVIETFYNLKFTKEALEKAYNSDAMSTFATSAPIIDYHDSYVDSNMHLNKIYKFIFIGLGLALHVPKIINKINPNIILIIEDDLELFRLSLFTCNYKEALQNLEVYFSIAENSTEFQLTFQTFYDSSFVRNHYLKFSLFSSKYEAKIKELQTMIVSRPEKCYSYERILYKNKKVLERIQHGYKYFNLSKKNTETLLSDKPSLVIGAGPSLHENISSVKKYQNKFIIIAAFAALKTLSKYNISPDIVTQLDEKVTDTELIINSFDSFDFLKNSLFILNASVPDVFFDKFKKENIYLVEDRSYYKQDKLYIEAASVGEFSYSLSLILNISQTYLLGLDLALGDDGLTHSNDHHNSSTLDISNLNKVQEILTLEKSIMTVKGNFKNYVTTTPLFAMSIPMVNNYTKNLKSDNQKVFNLSNGAYFENTIPLHFENIDYKKNIIKENLFLDLQQILDRYSSSSLKDKEIKALEIRQKQIKQLYNYIDTFQVSATSNSEQFIQEYVTMLEKWLNSDTSELRELLGVYFLNTSTYITDLYNTKELKNHKKHIKKIKKIIITQLKKIIFFYETFLLDTTKNLIK